MDSGMAIPSGRTCSGRNGHSADVLTRKPKRILYRGSSSTNAAPRANSPDWRDRRGSRFINAARGVGAAYLPRTLSPIDVVTAFDRFKKANDLPRTLCASLSV